jgi:hypothetical protein
MTGCGQKDATVVVKLTADSGYTATGTERISADQWGRICAIMAERPATKLESEA